MNTGYAAQWPSLAQVTNNLETALVSEVGMHLQDYSVEVQIDYEDYTAFIAEYSDWSQGLEQHQYDW